MNRDVQLFSDWVTSRPEFLAKKFFKDVTSQSEEITNLKIMVLTLRRELKGKGLGGRVKKLRAINQYSHNPNNVNKIMMLREVVNETY